MRKPGIFAEAQSPPSDDLADEFTGRVHADAAIVARVTRLYTEDAADQADLQQEILLQAWRAYPRFRGEAKFSTWLYRVAINVALTWRRRESKRPEHTELPDGSCLAAGQRDTDPRAERLYEAIRTLKPVERSLIAMHLDDYDHAEIGEALAVSPGAVATRLHRIKAHLTQLLTQQDSKV